jgi:cobalt-zinc-cadmium efflux system protein
MHIHYPTLRPAHHHHEHDHDEHAHHEHQHSHERSFENVKKQRLVWSIAITGVVMVVEIIGGLLSNSIALLSDGAHMFTHAFALAISLVAIILAAQKATYLRTFGLYRTEVIASLLNSLFLFLVTVGIIWESVIRIMKPESVRSVEMFVIALIGLLVNLATMGILSGSTKEDRNIRSAFLHMISDALSSVGVVIGAIVIYYTKVTWVDPIIGMLISVLILAWAWNLFKDSIRVLLEIAPKGMEIDTIREIIKRNDPRIVDVSDMHVVEITNGMYNFTAHVEVTDDSLTESSKVVDEINNLLCRRYNIHHTTIQVYRSSEHDRREGNLQCDAGNR